MSSNQKLISNHVVQEKIISWNRFLLYYKWIFYKKKTPMIQSPIGFFLHHINDFFF